MKLLNSINKFYFDMSLKELRLMNAKEDLHDVSYSNFLYLDIINYKKGCTVSYLAQALNLTKPAITMRINELIKHGYVEKTQSTKDKRINYLTVRPKVLEEFSNYDKRFKNAIDHINKHYTDGEIASFCEILELFSNLYSEETNDEQQSSSTK